MKYGDESPASYLAGSQREAKETEFLSVPVRTLLLAVPFCGQEACWKNPTSADTREGNNSICCVSSF